MTFKKKAKEDIIKYNLDTIRKTIETSKSLNNVRRTHLLGQNRLITLLDNQGREIQGNYKANIETLKAGEDTIAKALAKLYTKCISERRIPKDGDNLQKRQPKSHKEL